MARDAAMPRGAAPTALTMAAEALELGAATGAHTGTHGHGQMRRYLAQRDESEMQQNDPGEWHDDACCREWWYVCECT